MTLSPGDRIISIPTKTGPVLINAGTLSADQKVVSIMTRTGPVLIPAEAISPGDKVVWIPDKRGKMIAIKPGEILIPPITPDWVGRWMFGYAKYNDSAVVIAGQTGVTTLLSDVWISTIDKRIWTQQTATVEFGVRAAFGCVNCGNDIVVFAGGDNSSRKNDAWISSDGGASWTQQTANGLFTARTYVACTSIGNTIIMCGGSKSGSPQRLKDVWISTNAGASWSEQTSDAEFGLIQGASLVALSDGTLVLMGGNTTGDVYLNSVWESTDSGLSWDLVVEHASWAPRQVFGAVVLSDDSIVISGGTGGGEGLTDVWRSTNGGASWTQQTATAEYSARYGHGMITSSGKIYVIGGRNLANVKNNEGWKSNDKGKTWIQIF